jgi:hypothetical protein
MIYRWLVYDRQDSWFRLIADLDYNARTRPRVIFEHVVGRQRIEVHTAQLWRYAPDALYQFPDKTEFPYQFPGHVPAWEWIGKNAVIVHKGMSSTDVTTLVEQRAYFKWLAEGVHGHHQRHWDEARYELSGLGNDRKEVAKFAPPRGTNRHFHAPAIIEETIRKIVIDPRDKGHWVRVGDLNFPVERDTPVRIYGKKHGRFFEEMVVGSYLGFKKGHHWASMPSPGSFITLRTDDLVKYLWTRPGKSRVDSSDPKEGEFYWGMEPGEGGVYEVVKKVAAPI